MWRPTVLTVVLACTYAMASNSEVIKVDPAMKPYAKADGLSGSLRTVGSDKLHDLMVNWTDSFKKTYPTITLTIESKGSGSAPPALATGSCELAPMSRKMKDDELAAFKAKKGYPPTEIGVALDALSVFVHKDNPIDVLTLDQLDAIFSKAHKRKSGELATWKAVDPKSPLGDKNINLYIRDKLSGTHVYFSDVVMLGGVFRDGAKAFADSGELVKQIAGDPAGIGFSGIGFDIQGVKALKLIDKKGKDAVEPSSKNVLNMSYPLSRMLYIYVDKAPGKPLNPAVEEFIKFVLSKDGQELVVISGFIPVSARAAELILGKVKGT